MNIKIVILIICTQFVHFSLHINCYIFNYITFIRKFVEHIALLIDYLYAMYKKLNNYLYIKFNRLEIYWRLRKKGKDKYFLESIHIPFCWYIFSCTCCQLSSLCKSHIGLTCFLFLESTHNILLENVNFFIKRKQNCEIEKNTSFWKVVMYE